MTRKHPLPIEVHTGDCANVLKRLETDSIDLTVTSPPYGSLRTCYNHDFDFPAIAAELYRVTKPGGVVVWIVNDEVVNGSKSGATFRQTLGFMDAGFRLYDVMIWSKMAVFPSRRRYQAHFEYMLILSKGRPEKTNIIRDRKNLRAGAKVPKYELCPDGTRRLSCGSKTGARISEYGARLNIWEVHTGENHGTGHPAVFPIALARDHILSWSDPGDTVLDPFMGSGTTGVACRQTDRRFVGIDISPEYARRARKRILETQVNDCNSFSVNDLKKP
jgi:site-specific DNA-methyltransferase (adenine-specific)